MAVLGAGTYRLPMSAVKVRTYAGAVGRLNRNPGGGIRGPFASLDDCNRDRNYAFLHGDTYTVCTSDAAGQWFYYNYS